MAELMPEALSESKSKDVLLAMRKDLRTAARKYKGKTLFFVTAADVPLVDKKKMPLFIVVKLEMEAKAWQLALKAKKPTGLAIGTCTLQTKDGKSVQVALQKVKGERRSALKIAQRAFKLDPAITIADGVAEAEPVTGNTKWAAGLGVSAGTAVQQLAEALGLSEAEVSRQLSANANAVQRELEAFEREMEEEIGA